MKDKIREICYDLEIGCIDWIEASEQLLYLPDVVGQSEQYCDCDKPTLGNNVWTCGCGKPFKKKDK
jgi:hypothetical protein